MPLTPARAPQLAGCGDLTQRTIQKTQFVAALALGSLLAIVLAGCGGGSTAPTKPRGGIRIVAEPKPLLGVSEPNAWRRVPPPATPEAIAGLVASLGASSQRIVIDWRVAEPLPPRGVHRYQFESFDPMYRADVRHRIRPLLVMLNAPSWAADPGSSSAPFVNNPPATDHIADWQAFLRAVARRYPHAVGIEIWNEPNMAASWGGGAVSPDPDRYTELLRAAYGAIKSVSKRLVVIGGALAANQSASPAGNIPGREFADSMFADGAAAYMDGISLHPYPGTGGVHQTLDELEQVKQARDKAGARTPLWISEVGVSTTGRKRVSQSEQAVELVEICQTLVRDPAVEAVYFHNLIAQAGSLVSPEPGFGLVKSLPGGVLRPTPGFDALRVAVARRRCGRGVD